jgi:hypothetical protein
VEDPPPIFTQSKLVFVPGFYVAYHPIIAAIYEPYMGPTRRPPVVAQAHM